MVNRIDLTNQISKVRPGGVESPRGGSSQGNFAATLARESERQQSLKISSHAQKRLNSSQKTLSADDMQRIDGAVTKAGEKGSNQSLIMLDNMAFVVSVKNRVMITAVDEARQSEGIFTNIDSVVIA